MEISLQESRLRSLFSVRDFQTKVIILRSLFDTHHLLSGPDFKRGTDKLVEEERPEKYNVFLGHILKEAANLARVHRLMIKTFGLSFFNHFRFSHTEYFQTNVCYIIIFRIIPYYKHSNCHKTPNYCPQA